MMRAVMLFVGLSLMSAPYATTLSSVTDAGALSVKDFFKPAVFYDATLSPDGKRVLVVNHPDSEHQYITLIDLEKETSTDIVSSVDDSEVFSDLEWVSPDTAIFYDKIGKLGQRKLVAARILGDDHGHPKVKITIWPSDYWVLSPMHDGNDDVMLAENQGDGGCICVYRADIDSDPEKLDKKYQLLYSLDPKTDTMLTDKHDKIVAIETIDKKQVRHYLRAVDDESGRLLWKEFKKIDDANITFAPAFVAPDGHDYYVFSNLGHDTIGYYEYDPDTDKFVRTIYSNSQGDITYWHSDEFTDTLTYVTWFLGTDPHYVVLDARAKSFMPALRNAFPGQQVVPWVLSTDGKEVLVYVYSDVNPGAYYAFNLPKRQAQLLGYVRPWLKPEFMSPVKSVHLKTHDGFTISYLITIPKAGHKPFPMVVIPHGGPIGVFNVNAFDSETQLLVSRGYAVLKVNYRGSGGSGKAFEKAGDHQWGRKIEDDIEEAVHDVMRTEPVDPDRICIFGASYGGYSALMSVIRDPALYKCAASYAGVTDLPLLYDTTQVQFDKKVQDAMADIIGDPTTDAQKLRAVSPVYQAAKIRRPIFIAQGGQDTRVDVEQAYRLKLVMDTLNEPLDFKFYPDEIHGFNDSDDEVDFYLRLLDFLNRNIASNRPVAPPPTP
jgi:dipeptidyl aminopeptidase/acylaminoacyl peptidase